MWWWSRFLLVAVQVPGSPTDVTRVIIDDRVIYSAPKGLTLRWASREILRCAANLLKKSNFGNDMDLWLCWSTPKALWIGDHLRKSLPSRGYPTALKIFEIGNSEDQFATTITIITKIISMIILFIINIITFPNLWTPFSVASHLSHLNQTTVEAGHVFQTQTSEKYLVIFIIIPIPDHYILHSVARNLNIFCTSPSHSGLRELPKRCVFIKKVNKKM